MPLKTRRFIFYSFLFLFIVSGLGVIFYSQGWRPNTENCRFNDLFNCSVKLQKTGAVFIETQPKGVVIKLDDKVFQDKSGLIQSGTLITELSPKNYKIKIEKDGYLSWTKNFRVESGLVTEVPKIILLPEKTEKKLVSTPKPVDNFWINSQQKIVFKNSEALYYLQDSSPNMKLRGDKLIQWSEDGNKVILQSLKNQNYYLYELGNLSKTLNISAVLNNLQKTSISEIAFHPIESNRLIIENKNGLYLLDLNRLKLEGVKEPVLAWTIRNPNIYYIEKTQNFYLADFNLISKTSDTLIDLPDNLTAISEVSASGNKIGFLTKDGGLYLFNRENKNFKQIAHSAEKFIFSYDNKKIAFLDKDGKINIYFLEDYQRGLHKKAGEIISLNLYLKENGLAIKNIFWYNDSSHLLIDYSDADGAEKVDFIEIDDRLPINKYTLVEGVSNFYYEPISNRLYFTQENNLYFVEI